MPKKVFLIATFSIILQIFFGGIFTSPLVYKIQAQVVAPCDTHPIAVYTGYNYTGSCLGFDDHEPHLENYPGFDNSVSSVKIKSDYSAVLYADTNYTGAELSITSDISDLRTYSFDEKASSFALMPPSQGAHGGETPKPVSTVEFPNPLGAETFDDLLNKLFPWLYILSVPVLSLLILYGAFLMVTSAGAEEKYNQGIKIIKYGVIGFILVLLSGAIAAFIRAIVS